MSIISMICQKDKLNGQGGVICRTYTLVPGVIGHIISVNRNGTYYYHHYDLIGNVLFVSDTSGNRNTSYIQEGFGNVLAQSGSADNKYHLTTKEIDSDTGLYYFYARWYDSAVGRFVSNDLIKLNPPYEFSKNNPLKYIDPYGLDACDVALNDCLRYAGQSYNNCMQAANDFL